jgi:hypothetical protein
MGAARSDSILWFQGGFFEGHIITGRWLVVEQVETISVERVFVRERGKDSDLRFKGWSGHWPGIVRR